MAKLTGVTVFGWLAADPTIPRYAEVLLYTKANSGVRAFTLDQLVSFLTSQQHSIPVEVGKELLEKVGTLFDNQLLNPPEAESTSSLSTCMVWLLPYAQEKRPNMSFMLFD